MVSKSFYYKKSTKCQASQKNLYLFCSISDIDCECFLHSSPGVQSLFLQQKKEHLVNFDPYRRR